MRATNFQAVTLFNEVMGNSVPDHLTMPSQETFDLRMSLIQEEAVTELTEAYQARNLTAVADAICDGLFVLYGAANDFGMNIDLLFSEVVRSNMTKLCESEADAEYAVLRYKAGDGFHGKFEPINAAYRRCDEPSLAHKFVVYNADTGKVLKSPTFEEPQLTPLLAKMCQPIETFPIGDIL